MPVKRLNAAILVFLVPSLVTLFLPLSRMVIVPSCRERLQQHSEQGRRGAKFALARPEATAGCAAYPVHLFHLLPFSIAKIISATTAFVSALFGQKNREEPGVPKEEVKVLTSQGIESCIFDHRRKLMFEGVPYLGDRRARIS